MASTVFYHAAFIATCVCAVLWFISASRPLTSIKPGLDGLDRVAELSRDLKSMSNWNMWAATATGISAILQVLGNIALWQGS